MKILIKKVRCGQKIKLKKFNWFYKFGGKCE
nr:MAG TPA: hypothetical protein [Caudoviricetes sp.]DAT63669.1 MAG TPA: hypothetical protein [Caudoviricetes sp.]